MVCPMCVTAALVSNAPMIAAALGGAAAAKLAAKSQTRIIPPARQVTTGSVSKITRKMEKCNRASAYEATVSDKK